MTYDQIDSHITNWRAGLDYPEALNGPIAGLLKRLSPADLDIVKRMMRLNASSAMFHLLNVLDGTGDLEGQPPGAFQLSFDYWVSESSKEVEKLTHEGGDFLHDLFMEAHMDSLQHDGIV